MTFCKMSLLASKAQVSYARQVHIHLHLHLHLHLYLHLHLCSESQSILYVELAIRDSFTMFVLLLMCCILTRLAQPMSSTRWSSLSADQPEVAVWMDSLLDAQLHTLFLSRFQTMWMAFLHVHHHYKCLVLWLATLAMLTVSMWWSI